MSANEIKNIKNLGKKSLDEIGECLNNWVMGMILSYQRTWE